MDSPEKRSDDDGFNVEQTLAFGALLIAVVPVAPLVAIALLKVITAPWLTWVSALWLLPGWLVACTLAAGALVLPIGVLAWIMAGIGGRFLRTSNALGEQASIIQATLLAVFVFWSGSVIGGFLFILWKAARHNYG